MLITGRGRRGSNLSLEALDEAIEGYCIACPLHEWFCVVYISMHYCTLDLFQRKIYIKGSLQ